MPQLASQTTISGAELNSRPVATNTEILEAAPGLAVVQHSGSGKANQYYLRGYNLDHGTDLAIFWDDIPINLPTNAHGQGYADLNFLIPETISGLEVRKGPYFADIGDFANAGDLHLFLRDSVPQNIVSATVGSFGYDRFLTLGSTALGGGSLLYAGEFKTYDGPWVTGEDVRKFSGLLRYSQGTATNGFSATAMGYTNNWNSSDQVALRAITTGQIGRFGEIDPSDGGDTSRFMLSTRFAQSDDARIVEGECLPRQINDEPVEQLHLVHHRPHERRSVPPARRSYLWRRRRVAHDQWHAVQPSHRNPFRRADPLR